MPNSNAATKLEEHPTLKISDYDNLQELLEAYRIEENLSKAEMVRKLGVSLDFYTEVLNHDRRLSYKKTREWAHILGFPPHKLQHMVLSERIRRKLPQAPENEQEFKRVVNELVKDLEKESKTGSGWDTNEFLHLDSSLVSFFAAVPNKLEVEKVANEILIDVLIHKKSIMHSKLILDELKDIDPLTSRQRVEIQNILQQAVSNVVDCMSESVVKAAKAAQKVA